MTSVPITGFSSKTGVLYVATAMERRRILESIIVRERSRLLDAIRRLVPDPDESEDILQDTLLQLVRSFDTIVSVDAVAGWLHAVARNRVFDLFRRRRNRPTLSLDEPIGGGEDEPLRLADILPDDTDLPDQELFREQLWEQLGAALDELPPKQRAAFVQNEFEGKTFTEMAEETGESINTLLSRKRYAVQFLRKRLLTLYNELKA